MSRYTKEVNACLNKIARGEKSYFSDLFQLTANHLCMIAKKYLWNKSDYEDVVSDTYIKVHQYIHSFDSGQDGYNWLYKIVKNIALTYNEKEKLRIKKGLATDKRETITDMSEFDLHIDVERAFQKLDMQEREIVFEYFFKQYTLAEIAEKRGWVKSAVHKRIKKSLQKMEDFLT